MLNVYILIMGSLTDKAFVLEEILKIEDEIKQLKMDTAYLKIRGNLKILEDSSFGNSPITTLSPDNLDIKIETRRHSEEIKGIIRRYREKQNEYEEKINGLYSRKRMLEKQIFI